MDPRAPWGKARGGVHPLICHVLDTAVVAELLYDRLLGGWCREELEEGLAPLGNVRGWVSVLCGLHDLGKYMPAFQGLEPKLAIQRMGEAAKADIQRRARNPKDDRFDPAHGIVTAIHMEKTLRSWGASLPVAQRIAAALGGHHGRFIKPHDVMKVAGGGKATWVGRRGLVGEMNLSVR